MTEEEIMKQLKKACILDPLCYGVDCLYEEDLQAIRGLVDLYQKQKEDIMYLRMDVQELADDLELWQDRCADSIDKDEILKALGYEKNDEEYKRLYNKEELILSLIRTINEECDRLEDIEDQKTMLEIHNIENMRDKYWEDKIRDKIKELEKQEEWYREHSSVLELEDRIKELKELLEEK